jgi:hypothetical protein
MRTKLIFLSLLFCNIVLGQTIFVKVGPVFSNLKWTNSLMDETPLNKRITSFDLLVGLKYLNLKFIDLKSSIGFIQKGGSGNVKLTTSQGDSIDSMTLKDRLNYLTINTTVNLKIKLLKFIEPYIFIGPRIDYLLSYKENFNTLKQFEDVNELNKFSYGFLYGGGVNIYLNKILIGVSFDYYVNINKIVDYKSGHDVSNKITDHTYSLNGLVGYNF